MKKYLVAIAVICTFFFTSKADLVVDSLGITHVENAVITKANIDTLALGSNVMTISGSSLNAPKTSLSFNNGVRANDYSISSTYFNNKANLYAFSFGSGRSTAYFYNAASNTAIITAECQYPSTDLFVGTYKDASAPTSRIRADGTFFSQTGFITASDRNLKENIQSITNVLDNLKEIRPVSYDLKDNSTGNTKQQVLSVSENNNSTITAEGENRKKYGFIAQEIEEIFPNVVYTMPNGDKGIAYQEVIPILVGAIQEQQNMIDSLATRIEEMETPATQPRQQAPAAMQEAIADGTAALMQNTPNPFNQATEIAYRLPEGTATAMIMLCDMNGKMLQTYPLAVNTTAGTLTIQAGSYAPGMYLYTLLIDGVQIDTKQMIILAH